jgi:hypothetical protein
MTNNKSLTVTQKNINAGRNVVAGDYTENHYYSKETSLLAELFEKHALELELEHPNEIVAELAAYIEPMDIEGKLRDLSHKLTVGGRQAFLRDALWLKDDFRKMIERYRHSPSAQKIFAVLLSCIRTEFKGEIFHEINEMTDQHLENVLKEKVINPLHNQITGIDPLITKDSLYGMLYFLTGNCFLEWQK